MANELDTEDYRARYRELLAQNQKQQFDTIQDHERRLKIVEEQYMPGKEIREGFEKLADKIVGLQIKLAGLISVIALINKVVDHVWKP